MTEARSLHDKVALVAFRVLEEAEKDPAVQDLDLNFRLNTIAHAIATNLTELKLVHEPEANRVLVFGDGAMNSGPQVPTCPKCGAVADGPNMTMTHEVGCEYEKGDMEW